MILRSHESARAPARAHAVLATAIVLTSACAHDSRNIHAASTALARSPAALEAKSWVLCPLVGPRTHSPGIYGTDLGFTVKDPSEPTELAILFGDTWARPGGACQFPLSESDDLQAFLPSARPPVLAAGPPGEGAEDACRTLGYVRPDEDDRTSWRRVRLLQGDREHGESVMDTGQLRTPVAAFADGKQLFTIYTRDAVTRCKWSRECPSGFACSTDPDYGGTPLGACAHTSAASDDALPAYCRDVGDCRPGLLCKRLDRGVCLSTRPFETEVAGRRVSPSWYRDDPRLGMARTMYVAARVSKERPADYRIVERFVTTRFANVAAKTVAHFDEAHPETNDYRPGTHTLLLWGRAGFVGSGGAQALPFLLHVPLADLSGAREGRIRWKPRFFAGYDAGGAPRWSDRESEATPVYGTEARPSLGGDIEWVEPEFDYVNQMTLTFVVPLERWVMLYGGDAPAFLVRNKGTGAIPDPTYLQRSPGAIHLRTAPHPWGRLRAEPLTSEGFSSPLPVLTRRDAAHYLACGDGGETEMPGCVRSDELDPADEARTPVAVGTAIKCLLGDLALSGQRGVSGNPIGRLYAPNVIDEWTTDVTARGSDGEGAERAAEIYWNVSTWNPYQVVLVKTLLRARAPR